MASDPASVGRSSGKRAVESGFQWVSSSPPPAVVARLEETFPEVVCIPAAELAAEVACWQQSAVIARTYHKWVPAEALIRELRRAGISGEIKALSLAYRCHILRFDSPEARNLALQRPWVVNGQAVGTEAWSAEFVPAEDSIPQALVWVRLPNLPLEFWKEAFIRAILEPVGDFVCIDAATKVMNRGGFARACIRIDLRRPLRPGVRIQGISLPFWQQISYECLDGVCLSCGSLHLGVPCSKPECSADVGSVSEPEYGPWLVAVRQRKAAAAPLKAVKGKTQVSPSDPSAASPVFSNWKAGIRSGSSVSPDGWITPGKSARRRPSPATKPASGPAPVMVKKGSVKVSSAMGEEGVPVDNEGDGTVHSELPGQLNVNEDSEHYSAASTNPFAALAMAAGVEDQLGNKDASTAPLKRARSEVSGPPRSIPRIDKRRGKGKVLYSKNMGSFSCSLSLANQLPIGQNDTQVLVLAQSQKDAACDLKMDSQANEPGNVGEGHLASSSVLTTVDTLTGGGIVDSVMLEDQGGVPASSSL